MSNIHVFGIRSIEYAVNRIFGWPNTEYPSTESEYLHEYSTSLVTRYYDIQMHKQWCYYGGAIAIQWDHERQNQAWE